MCSYEHTVSIQKLCLFLAIYLHVQAFRTVNIQVSVYPKAGLAEVCPTEEGQVRHLKNSAKTKLLFHILRSDSSMQVGEGITKTKTKLEKCTNKTAFYIFGLFLMDVYKYIDYI